MDAQAEKCVMVVDEQLPLGIIEFPVPILKGSPETIKKIREKLYQPEFQDLSVVDFTASALIYIILSPSDVIVYHFR